ncbi:MAG TPA: hypothetical protein PKJ14_07660 [Candidatus Cloacimonadota bacterium]|nr:hypothetical protein [Candidatus Cloacimonadota bacterium]HQL15377.1 hypothetical protein [Candidatus Cloacimonadota bacterium]
MQTLQKFITYNKSYFDFLNITPILEGDEQDIELRFKTTNYIGSIPLKAPNSGKQISDLLVVPRFSSNTNYTDLLDILDKIKCYIQPEFMEGLFLKSKISTAPPLSYEIIKFFNLLMKVVSFNWTKFIRKEVNSRDASGLINWNRYIIHLNDLQQWTVFPLIKNSLSAYHRGLAELKYVFEIGKIELQKANLSYSAKISIKNTIQYIDSHLATINSQPTSDINISVADPEIVKECKTQANIILKHQFSLRQPWRIDMAAVFEKFVQYIFDEISKEAGLSSIKNYKFRKSGDRSFTWELNYLEPDILIYKDSICIVVEAKYKSHLFNKDSTSAQLKDDFRSDLHQLLAYTSFLEQKNKIGLLCYPSSKYGSKIDEYINPQGNVKCFIGLVGIPFSAEMINDTIANLRTEIEKLFTYIEVSEVG